MVGELERILKLTPLELPLGALTTRPPYLLLVYLISKVEFAFPMVLSFMGFPANRDINLSRLLKETTHTIKPMTHQVVELDANRAESHSHLLKESRHMLNLTRLSIVLAAN